MELTPIDILKDDGTEEAGISISVDAVPVSDLNGVAATGAATLESDVVVAVVAYPASDVSSLNVSSLGSKVRTALLALT